MMPSQQVRRGDLQRLGGFDLSARVTPQDRRTAFRRDDAVDRELVHQHAIADGNAEGAAAATLAVHDDDDGTSSIAISRRFRAIASATPRSSDSMPGYAAGVSTKQMIGRRNFSASSSGAAPCGSPPGGRSRSCGRSSASCRCPSGGRPRAPGCPCSRPCRDDGVIVGEAPIAVQLDEFGEQPLDVIERGRARRVARHQHALPRRQVACRDRRGSRSTRASSRAISARGRRLRQHRSASISFSRTAIGSSNSRRSGMDRCQSRLSCQRSVTAVVRRKLHRPSPQTARLRRRIVGRPDRTA